MRSGNKSPHPSNPLRNTPRLDLTFKIGGNGGHSHNDIGTYAINIDTDFLVGEPGGPRFYEARTFGPDRYKSPLINSYGHPLPTLNGLQQLEAVGVLRSNPVGAFRMKTSFSERLDTATVDFLKAYNTTLLPAVRSLVRTVELSRTGEGEARVTDTLTTTTDQKEGVKFESVFTVLGRFTLTEERKGVAVSRFGRKAVVSFEASGGYEVKTEVLSDYGVTWTRVGVLMDVKGVGSVTVKVVPFEEPSTTKGRR
ncbi:hypothetical protein HDV05_002426 [Chytridiales sp. JEL 0842]|nr:hypothetical protein HDV05_002426 [Chytridiales sp. JEL 0842]